MITGKLYTILSKFDKIEQNRLRKYVQSPYFNVNESLTTFFEYLIRHINSNVHTNSPVQHLATTAIGQRYGNVAFQDKQDLDKCEIWRILFEYEPYNDTRFRKLCSDLLELVENFLAQQVYDHADVQQAAYLLEAVSKKRLDKLYLTCVRQAQLASKQQPYKNAEYYYGKFLLEKNFYEMHESELNRGDKTNIEEMINHLDHFYLTEKLRSYCTVLSHKTLISHDYKLLFIDEIIAHIEKYKARYEEVPVIAIYYHILLTQTDTENTAHYFKLIDLLDKHHSRFAPDELYKMYISALNYCTKRVNKNDKMFLNVFHDLYKILLKKEILFYGTPTMELSPWHFKNVVLIANRLGEYNWTENFIKEYQHKLPKELRESAVSYNLANVYFNRKQYDKVQNLLQSVEYQDLTYSLGSKTMLTIIYYEKDEFEALDSILKSFQTYLNRHKDIAENRRLAYLYLIKFVKRMTKIMPGDKKAVEQLKQEVLEANTTASRDWILEKLKDLE
ncbi:MAG: hypothetical protein RLZZ628_30 [Bacteroidota bacterium]|jgi:hypothetical protein